ncbi:MAG: iron ABC transporter permease [Cellvibrionales bacterium]|nr:iron ABC transporter permease [Cellvibrionales bacterium]
MLVGPTALSLRELAGATGTDWLILRELRAPRALLAAAVGAVLATSGAVLQGLFRNPLADPSLIGVSAGASVGASASILLGGYLAPSLGAWLSTSALSGLSVITLGAFAGGMAAVGLVYRLSTRATTGTSVTTMLLVGIAISALAGALNNGMALLADNQMLRRMSLWQMGNLDLANWQRVQLCLAVGAAVALLLRGQAAGLNALLLGESEARHLGVDVERLKRRLILLTALGVGVATALVGTIAFIGLIVPHLVRLLAGPCHRSLLPASALLGAILLGLADLLARLLLAPTELPVGLLTAFLGAPFFLYLLRRRHA